MFVWILWFSFLFLAGWPWLYSIYFNFDLNFCFHSRLGDLDWMNGAMSGTVYNSSHELGALMTEVLLFICFLLVCFCLSWIANLLDDLRGGWLDLVIFWRLFILCDDPMATTRCKKPFSFVFLIFLFGLDCDDPMPRPGVRPGSLDQPSSLWRLPRAEKDGSRGRFVYWLVVICYMLFVWLPGLIKMEAG